MDKFNRYHKTNIVASQLNQGLSLTKQQNVKITGHHKKECFIVWFVTNSLISRNNGVCYLPWTRNDTLTIITLFSGRPWLRMICTRFQDCIHLQKKTDKKFYSLLTNAKKKKEAEYLISLMSKTKHPRFSIQQSLIHILCTGILAH